MTHQYIQQIPHLIWVPSFNCKSTCDFCYLKNGELSVSRKWDIEGFKEFLKYKNVNQLTISLDADWNSEERRNLGKICKTTISVEKIFLTFRDEISALTWLVLDDFLINGLFISSVKEDLKSLKILKKKLFERNIIFGINLRDSAAPYLRREILQQFDIIQLLLTKPKLGNNRLYPFFLQRYQYLHDRIEEEGLNFLEDPCISALRNIKNEEATTCSAGIQTTILWPNRKITGCPYNSNGIENEFTNCKLREYI